MTQQDTPAPLTSPQPVLTKPAVEHLVAYTDGATAIRNPGLAGAACILQLSENDYRCMAQHLGHATNNVAELSAISLLIGWFLRNPENQHPLLIIYSDSEYAIGVCSGQKRASANKELVYNIQAMIKQLEQAGMKIGFAWVQAHAKDDLNNTADLLAKYASYNTTCHTSLNGVKAFNREEFLEMKSRLLQEKK